jgi:hypothetical protein
VVLAFKEILVNEFAVVVTNDVPFRYNRYPAIVPLGSLEGSHASVTVDVVMILTEKLVGTVGVGEGAMMEMDTLAEEPTFPAASYAFITSVCAP